jgi:serine/threonine protein kinase
MGAVWAGYDEILHRRVAVKEVAPPSDLTPEQREAIHQRTMREARAAARLTHPSVVTVYDVVEDGDRPWIVMELLTPLTLGDIIASEGPMEPSAAARIGLDVLDALRTAHRVGVLHRDVKPGNVIMSDTGRAVLTDFGIAMVEGDPALTVTGMLVGSPGYMSPERARGDRPTAASDLWSLGATLFAAVEGNPPFRRDGQLQTLFAVITEQPPPAPHAGPLQDFIARLLERDPARRPNAAQAYQQLRRLKEAMAVKDNTPRVFAFAKNSTVKVEPTLSTTKPDLQPVEDLVAASSAPRPTAGDECEPETAPGSEAKAESEPEPTAEPEPGPGPETTPGPQAEAEPEPEPQPEPATEPEPDPGPETTSGPQAEAEPSTAPEPEPAAEPEPEPQPEPAAEPEPEPQPEPVAEAESESKIPTGSPRASEQVPVRVPGEAAQARASGTAATDENAAEQPPDTAQPRAGGRPAPMSGPASGAEVTPPPRVGPAKAEAGPVSGARPKAAAAPRSTARPHMSTTVPRPVPSPPPVWNRPSRPTVAVTVAGLAIVLLGGWLAIYESGRENDGPDAVRTTTTSRIVTTVTAAGSPPLGSQRTDARSTPDRPRPGAAQLPVSSTPPPSSGQTLPGQQQTAPRQTAQTRSQRQDPAGTVPQGFRIHEDPTGFRVAVPATWKRSVSDTRTFFRDPGTSGYLLIDQTTTPKKDVLADWQGQESQAGRSFPGYRKIRLERVDYKGFDSADWEFTWRSSGTAVHVINRNVRVSDRRAYALYWSVPDKEWGQRLTDFQTIAASFQPAS